MGSIDTITKLAFSKALKQLEEKMQQFSYGGSRKTRFEAEKTKERIMQIACREGELEFGKQFKLAINTSTANRNTIQVYRIRDRQC